MTAEKQRSYRFGTQAQWSACITAGVDSDALRGSGIIRPLLPYALLPVLHEASGASAPTVTRAGEIIWGDDQCVLYRMPPTDDDPLTFPAPPALTRATRIVATSSGLWVLSTSRNALECYDEESLTRCLTVELPNVRLVDITSDGDFVVVLIDDHDVWKTVRIDARGHVVETTALHGVANAEAIVFLRRARRFVVLVGGRPQKLVWFAPREENPLFSLAVAGLRPCYAAMKLGSDSRERILLAGADGGTSGGAHVLVLDAEGNVAGDVPLDSGDTPVTGVAATKDTLLVTGPRGLLLFRSAETVPEGATEVRTTIVTPMLYSPDREDGRRWLRVDASAHLPKGSSIEIAFAATDDVETRDRLNGIVADGARPESHRLRALLSEPELWRGRTVFEGTEPTATDERALYSAKLFDVAEQQLWVAVTLSAAPGARLPWLAELNVLYPGLTLMDKLPSIYQREEAQPDSFVRNLVGVLETTTQEVDARIASMGSHVNPSTAPAKWLDFIARWLGVPWDDGLSERQKRAIVVRAAELAKGRGTRAGLETLLDCLLPGSPPRFRVTDTTADHGFAIVGGDSCTGSALPAMLGGRTRWSPELDSRAVLGYTRLPCPAQLDDGAWQLAGRVRVEIAATPTERKAWEPWFRALVMELMPVTARLELRWVSADALCTDRLDGTLTITSAPTTHLGVDAVTGVARLPERGTRLSASGSNISTRLR